MCVFFTESSRVWPIFVERLKFVNWIKILVYFIQCISIMSCEITQKLLDNLHCISYITLCTVYYNSPHNLYHTTSDLRSHCYISRRSLYWMDSLSSLYNKEIQETRRLFAFISALLMERLNMPVPYMAYSEDAMTRLVKSLFVPMLSNKLHSFFLRYKEYRAGWLLVLSFSHKTVFR